jgi:hypothetical protein
LPVDFLAEDFLLDFLADDFLAEDFFAGFLVDFFFGAIRFTSSRSFPFLRVGRTEA